jgi:Pyridine nucleotide-disulphide oxidoreductase, dimerisation domain
MTKLLFDEATGHVIGCGIVGPSAGELIAEAAMAIEMGADAADIGLTFTLTRHCRRPSPWQRRHSRAPSPTCSCRNGDSRLHGVVPARNKTRCERLGRLAGW